MKVLISLGSNYLPAAHIQWASQRLSCLLTDMRMSRCLWTADVKGTGVFYMNRLAVGNTPLSLQELNTQLKDIEKETNRVQGRVTIDLDIMLYGDERLHERDWPRPYIQQLINDVL
jgi:2-amino-4-hydroxy-6-hydroxymethyldihydropteridine diphosphokinase